ncbi:AHH domain-containing protein [Streptomyces sp. NPDC001657]|uniref:AHH domain-containing protein n=1 Tax=Streptomyces sp. NPDC001657 TaxID=3154522 RepID=UPI00331F364F
MSAGGDTLNIRPHLPDADSVTFERTGDGELRQEQRRALQEVLVGAVARVVEGLQPVQQPVGTLPQAGPVQAETAVDRTAASDGALGLSFMVSADVADVAGVTDVTDVAEDAGGAGESAGPQRPEPVASSPAGPAPESTAPSPSTAAAPAIPSTAIPGAPESPAERTAQAGQAEEAGQADRVVEGASALEGQIVMILTGGRVAALGGDARHVRAGNLTRAIQLGLAVFGTTSFALLEGPVGDPESGFWALATTPSVSNENLKRAEHRLPTGREVQQVGGGDIRRSLVDDAGHRYAVLAVVTKERNPLAADPTAARQLAERMAEGGPGLPEEETRRLAFGDLDQLVEQVLGGDDTRLQEVADRLARFDAEGFSLVDWPAKSRYLQVLIDAWTLEEHERAIVEIMKSLSSLAELRAVQERLAEAHVAEQLFSDIGDTLWDLLVTVGARFGGKEPLTVEAVGQLFREAFELSPELREEIRRQGMTGEAAQVGRSVLIQVEAAIVAVVNLLRGMVEGLAMLVTRPAQILEGLGQLARLIVLFELAGIGYAPARAECALVVKQIGPKLVAGLRGVALLRVGERVLTRVQWAVIVEVASWFVGIGALKAAAESAGLAEKLAVLARFLGLIGKIARTAEGELIAARLLRLARAMRAGSAILREVQADEEILRLLSYLPVEDERRLGKLLERFEVSDGTTLAELAAHSELGPVVRDSLHKAEILHTFAAKSGGLTEELGQAFRRLAGPDGFGERDLGALAEALEPGEGRLFLAIMEHIGYGRIGPGAEVGIEFLTVLAADTMRMDAVREVGYPVVSLAFERAAGETAAFDRTLRELARLQDEAHRQGKAAEFATMLEYLERGDPPAWNLVAGAGSAAHVERAAVMGRIKRIRARYRGRAAGRRAMENRLNRLRDLSRTNPALTMEIIEEFEARRLDRAGKFADEDDLAAAFEDAARHASPDERALLHEPEEAPAEALSLTDRPHQPTGTDSASAELADAMEKAGEARPAGHDAHHIVADRDPRGEVGRQILREAGIEPRNSALNGVYLPRTSMDPRIAPQAATRHQTVHTNAYYKRITEELLEARRKGNVRGRLAEIKGELVENPSFQGWAGFDDGESYADWLVRHRAEIDWLTDEAFEELVQGARAQAPTGVRIAEDVPEVPVGPRVAAEPLPPPEPPSGELLDEAPEPAPAVRRRRRLPRND